MNGKLLAGIIAIMLLVNGILITIALRKGSDSRAPIPAQIVQDTQDESTKKITKTSSVEKIPKSGLESCFNYYNYGKVRVELSPDKSAYSSEGTIRLIGNIVNNNDVPLVDLVLYTQLRRINTTSYDRQGHHLIDAFSLKEDLHLQANETKHISLEVPIKSAYPQGNYQLQHYVFSKYGFHYGGRPFLEEDFAGSSNLTLESGSIPDVYFDIDAIRVKGTNRNIRGITQEYADETIPFEIALNDVREQKSPIPVTVKFYQFEDVFASNLVQQYKLTYDPQQPLQVSFKPPTQGAYMMIAEADTPVRTMLRYRFGATAAGLPELRMNDIGVSDFPAEKDGRAWVCFHSPAAGFTPKTAVTLSLFDSNNALVETNNVSYALSPDVLAISVPLEKLGTPNNFSVKAQFENVENPEKKREVQLKYTCDRFTDSIADFSVIHTSSDPYKLVISATNRCGEQVKTGRINNIRILQNEKVLQEETNVLTLPYTMSLKELSGGRYQAQVKMGKMLKEIIVEIPEQEQIKKPTIQFSRISVILYIVISIVIVVTILIVIQKRRKS